MFTKKENIMRELGLYKSFLEDLGYNVYAVTLKGSQNYNLSDSESDVDATAIVIPTLVQLCKRQDIVKKYMMENGEMLVNDIFTFSKHATKGNPAWIEMINTEYMIGDLSVFKGLRVNPKAVKGMMYEKRKALTHRYPSRAEWVDKFGFDPKQLHHIIRLADLIAYSRGIDYIFPMWKYSDDASSIMMKVKRQGQFYGGVTISKAYAVDYADKYIKLSEIALEKFEQPNNIEPLEAIENIIKESIRKELI